MTDITENTNNEATAPEKNKGGRPSEYTIEKAYEICALIAEGNSVRTICMIDIMPSLPTFYRWIREQEEFRNLYASAKEDQSDALAEELLDISDDGTNDWMEARNKKGEIIIVLDKEHIARSRLRVDTRKFLMAKMRPKKYGDSATIRQQLLDEQGKPTKPNASADPYLIAALEAVKNERDKEE